MRHNAMKFGLYAKSLPGESEAEHHAFVQDLRDELKPHGPMQEVLFFQIVEDHCALKRLSLASHAYLLFKQRVIAARSIAGERAVYEGRQIVKEVEEVLAAELGNTVDLSPYLDDMLRSTVDDLGRTGADVERRRHRMTKSMIMKRNELKRMQKDEGSAEINPQRPPSLKNEKQSQIT